MGWWRRARRRLVVMSSFAVRGRLFVFRSNDILSRRRGTFKTPERHLGRVDGRDSYVFILSRRREKTSSAVSHMRGRLEMQVRKTVLIWGSFSLEVMIHSFGVDIVEWLNAAAFPETSAGTLRETNVWLCGVQRWTERRSVVSFTETVGMFRIQMLLKDGK